VRISREQVKWWFGHCVASLALPVVLFWATRPEQYSLTPNGLDPFFYTGYVTNFDDIAREIGDKYYFVSRWSAYLPGRLFAELAGPSNGRLWYRLFLTSAVLLSFWSLGRRWEWKAGQKLLVGLSIVASPIFARSLFTDYVEHFVVPAGCVLVSQAMHTSRTVARSLVLGVLFALIAVANPYAILPVLPALLVYCVSLPPSPFEILKRGVPIGLGASLTIIAGLFWYRSHYGIQNVYLPTFTFMRNNVGFVDPLRSPRLDWMTAFLWIYVPGLILVVMRFGKTFWNDAKAGGYTIVWWILASFYAFQWFDQFLRHGPSLEIPYYFVLIYPATALVLALLIGSKRWTLAQVSFMTVSWILLVLRIGPLKYRMPNRIGILAGLVIAVVFILLISKWSRPISLSLLVLLIISSQVSAPVYDPSSYHPYNLSPEYSKVFAGDQTKSAGLFGDTLWMESELDKLPSDSGLFFCAGGEATNMVGVYGPHVTGHLVQLPENGGALAAPMLASLVAFRSHPIVLFGPPSFVAKARSMLETQLPLRYMDLGTSPVLRYQLSILNRQ
jgi:hypothetical protein